MLNPMIRKRTERATDTLPQTAAEALFTVVNGRVVVTQILGEVTTAIQNQANNTKLTHNPSTGTSTDLCAVLNIANDEVSTLYGITGLFSDAMIGAGQAVSAQTRDVVLKPGTIDLDCAASNTGSVKWTLFWRPIDDGAYVTAS
jgi:hypothetical protein